MEAPRTVQARKPNFLQNTNQLSLFSSGHRAPVIMIFPMIYSIYLAFVQYFYTCLPNRLLACKTLNISW